MNQFDRQQLRGIIHSEFQTNNLSPTNHENSMYNYNNPQKLIMQSPSKIYSKIQPICIQQSITPQKKQYADFAYCPNPDTQKTARSKSLTPSKYEIERLFNIQSELKQKIETYIHYIEQSKKEEELIQASKYKEPILKERFSFQNLQGNQNISTIIQSNKKPEKENQIIKRPTISTQFSTSKNTENTQPTQQKKTQYNENINQFIEKYERMLTVPNQMDSYIQSTAQSSEEYTRIRTSNFGKNSKHEESLLTKLEMIQCQLGIQGRQRCIQTDQSDEGSKYSDLDRQVTQNPKKTKLEAQEQQFSPSLDSEPQQLKSRDIPEFNQNDTEVLQRIEEAQNEETEEDITRNYYKNITPSLKDINGDSNKQFQNFYDKRMIYSLLMIDKNIKKKEQELETNVSTQQNDNMRIDQQRKSFDQFYQEYITEEVSGLEIEIQDIQKYNIRIVNVNSRFLKKVKSSNRKLKSSLKDLYRTITFNQNDISTDDKPWIKSALSTPFTKQNSSQSSSDDRNITNIQQRIIEISKDLGQIDEIRKIMLKDLQSIESSSKREDGIKHLKYLKGQINDQFQKVEKDIRLLNEEYSESDSNAERQIVNRTKFETQKQKMSSNEQKHISFSNFETEYNKVYEYADEEESSQY